MDLFEHTVEGGIVVAQYNITLDAILVCSLVSNCGDWRNDLLTLDEKIGQSGRIRNELLHDTLV